MRKLNKRTRRATSIVEYAVLLGAITLVALVGLSFLGNKTGDIIGALATTLPGANALDDLSIESHMLVEYQDDGAFYLNIDTSLIGAEDATTTYRMADNVGFDPTQLETLVLFIP